MCGCEFAERSSASQTARRNQRRQAKREGGNAGSWSAPSKSSSPNGSGSAARALSMPAAGQNGTAAKLTAGRVFLNRLKHIAPSGKSTKTCLPLAAKISCWSFRQIRITSYAVSSPRRGVGHRHQTLGWDAVDASASGIFSAGRKRRGVRRSRVVLMPRCWRQVLEKQTFSGATVTTSPAHRGEHEVSCKAIAQGMPECSPLTCMLVCAFFAQFGTRDRGCSAHPAFPAPSQEGGTNLQNSGRACRGDACYRRHLCSAWRQRRWADQ